MMRQGYPNIVSMIDHLLPVSRNSPPMDLYQQPDVKRASDAMCLPVFAATLLLGSAAIGVSGGAWAATPGAGQILQEMPAPSTAPSGNEPSLNIERPKAGAIPATQALPVTHIVITGNTLFPASQLHALVSDGEGKQLNLAEVHALAERITAFYQQHGYPLDRAYIPAQTMKEGALTIAVLEARYGQVTLDNSSQVNNQANSGLLKATLAPLKPGDAVAQAPLDRQLLLLSDFPGVIVGSTLRPGAVAGTSDLAVKATPGAVYNGVVGIDDYGNRYTGRPRVNGGLTFNNPFHLGDQLNINALSSGRDLNYGRLGYQSIINGQGTTLGGSFAALRYRLGHGLETLDAHGTAQTAELTAMQPLIRSIKTNLYLRLAYDHKWLKDRIDSSGIRNDRHTDALTATLSGDHRDRYGISNASLSLTTGHLAFDDASAEQADAAGPDARGSYQKLNLSLARLQRINDGNSLYLAFNGQMASKNLDASEQFFLGGPNNVRGYDVAAVSGDQGMLVTAELRHDLALPVAGQWQASAFVDSGYIQINKSNAFTARTSNNSATLTSAGLGLNWNGPLHWQANASIATPVGHRPDLVGQTNTTRFWIQVRKGF